jgi:hypothetical protein
MREISTVSGGALPAVAAGLAFFSTVGTDTTGAGFCELVVGFDVTGTEQLTVVCGVSRVSGIG